MAPVIVIYHANCCDGFCAAWLFHHAFPDAEFHAAHYGTEPPDVKGKQVFVVDFSYKMQALLTLLRDSGDVTILDHHKTAEEELRSFATHKPGSMDARISGLTCVFDMDKSGGRLAWEHLYNITNPCWPRLVKAFPYCDHHKAPWLVDYTESRDLWTFHLPFAREINAALRSYPSDFVVWDSLERALENDPNNMRGRRSDGTGHRHLSRFVC